MNMKKKMVGGLVFGVVEITTAGSMRFIVPCIGTSQDQVEKWVLKKWAGAKEIRQVRWFSEKEFRKALSNSRTLDACISFVLATQEAITLPPVRSGEIGGI